LAEVVNRDRKKVAVLKVFQKTDGAVAPLAQQSTYLLRAVAMIYVEFLSSPGWFVGLAYCAASTLRGMHVIVLIFFYLVVLPKAAVRVSFAPCASVLAHVGAFLRKLFFGHPAFFRSVRAFIRTLFSFRIIRYPFMSNYTVALDAKIATPQRFVFVFTELLDGFDSLTSVAMPVAFRAFDDGRSALRHRKAPLVVCPT
jgi:hypothetical protein